MGRKISEELIKEYKESHPESTDPCDYCMNSNGISCPVRACMEYSRWRNNGFAPKEVIEKVEDFHYDRW